MPLKNMKVSKKEAKKDIIDEEPKYPWGLRLHFDEESVSKLDIEELPKQGDKVMIVAFANVDEVGDIESQRGRQRHIDLQLTDVSIEEKADKDTLSTLYGDEEK